MARVKFFELEGRRNTLIVTFNEMWNVYSDQRFWGEKVIRKLDFPAYGLVTEGPNWFPVQDTVLALREVIKKSRIYDKTVLYGYSMGAYAAIKYSSLFDNPVVLAFSPQFSIDPDDCADQDERYKIFFDAVVNRDMKIKPIEVGGKIYIFYDPCYAPDDFHVRNMPGNLTLIPMRLINHDTINAISSSERLSAIIGAAIADDKVQLCRLARSYKKSAPTYRRNMLIEFASKNRLSWGLNYIDICGNLLCEDAWALMVSGQIQYKSGYFERAAANFGRAYSISKDENHLMCYNDAVSKMIDKNSVP